MVHSHIHAAAQEEEGTSLKKWLDEFGELLTVIIGVISALVWFINVDGCGKACGYGDQYKCDSKFQTDPK
ncbi:hypothetical protein FRX31_017864 [Thalictrum thalictroides]|uniref:Transmembrane protein n=1 Tax=Thalictrum thalictroides TaxID=46969 RepID=A0A7J6W599_THATH|nr:hypothetical protein FRX31_017864 [Thalictrum thalictroides]